MFSSFSGPKFTDDEDKAKALSALSRRFFEAGGLGGRFSDAPGDSGLDEDDGGDDGAGGISAFAVRFCLSDFVIDFFRFPRRSSPALLR